MVEEHLSFTILPSGFEDDQPLMMILNLVPIVPEL